MSPPRRSSYPLRRASVPCRPASRESVRSFTGPSHALRTVQEQGRVEVSVDHNPPQQTKTRTVLVVVGGAALLALTVFKVPLATVLLVGVWLVCPLMMMGMHGGHGHGNGSVSGDDSRGGEEAPAVRGDPVR